MLRVMKLFSITLAVSVLLGGCVKSTTVENSYDPAIGFNRAMHGVNKGFDQVLIRPLSVGYGAVVPKTIKHVINNEVRFLSLPGTLINSLLQGNIERAGDTAARLFVNGTWGGLGLLDPATDLNIPEHDEDFGQTLAVWGLNAGPYVELPLLGPSSARGILGRVGDMALDPTTYISGNAITALNAGKRVGSIIDTRYRFQGLIDEALYDSPDSYAMVRNLYLQRRNNAILNGNISGNALPDIYEAEPF